MIGTASYSDIGGRERNEDHYKQTLGGTKGICMVLADGLGGHGNGELASEMACKTICNNWKGQVDRNELIGLVQEAQKQVLSLHNRYYSMKTTVVVLTTDRVKAAWAHVGDSRLYHFHNKKLVFQTKDHSASQIAVMLGDITPDQIRFHEDRSTVYRALGQEGEIKVEAQECELLPGHHAFLLCSDGFWEYVLEAEMEEDLKNAVSAEDWLNKMRARLKQRVPADNDNNTAAVLWQDSILEGIL